VRFSVRLEYQRLVTHASLGDPLSSDVPTFFLRAGKDSADFFVGGYCYTILEEKMFTAYVTIKFESFETVTVTTKNKSWELGTYPTK
jgi:hypothetical protein